MASSRKRPHGGGIIASTMSELPPDTSGETDPLSVEFGDVVEFPKEVKPFSHDRLFLAVEPPKGNRVEMIALADETHPVHGLPGTEEIDSIDRIVGHFSFEKVVGAYACMLSRSNSPSAEHLAEAKKALQKYKKT